MYYHGGVLNVTKKLQENAVLENDSDVEIIEDDDLNVKVEYEEEEKNFFNCNCREEDKLMSTHYCDQCTEYIMIRNWCKKWCKIMIEFVNLDYNPRKRTTFVIQIHF